MAPLVVLFIFILVVLFVWWALMRNAKEYEPGFEVHPHEETGAHDDHGATAHITQPAAAEHAPVEAALVEAAAVNESARELAPAASAAEEEPLGFASPEFAAAAADEGARELAPATTPLEEEPLGFASPEFAATAADEGARDLAPAAAPVEEKPLEEEPLGFVSPELAVAAEAAVARDLPQPDDLIILEGIGPKVAQVLKDAGITTFAQLAQADTAHLRQVLNAAGLRMLDPSTWPEQAQLAAGGKFQELEELTSRLRGGRRAE